MRTGRPRQFDVDTAIDAALVLFWENGFEATSLAQLRDCMGLSSASIYAAFGSKEGVFDAVIQRYVDSYGQVTLPLADVDRDPREAIEKTLRDSVAMQTDPAHPPGCLIGLGGLIAGAEGDRRGALAARRTNDRNNISQCIERAIARGDLAPHIPVTPTASVIHSFLLGLSPLARDGLSAEELQDSVTQMMRFWDSMQPDQR